MREGAAALTRRDDYLNRLSPFDRQVRLKTDRDVSPDEFTAFISTHVRPWTDEEVERLTALLQELAEKLRPWKLNLPPVIQLVKTSGREEAGAAYCRGAAIVLPQNLVDNRRGNIKKILPHEVFHILSSHNPKLRRRLYAIIGFRPSNEVSLPEALRARRITNPDAPLNNYYITADDGSEWMPVLVSKSDRYDPAAGGSLFTYLDFKLMQLAGDAEHRRPAMKDGMPILVEPSALPDYARQIGDNTKYIIHPEEILADNFVHLVDGRSDLPNPEIVDQMGQVLRAESRSRRE